MGNHIETEHSSRQSESRHQSDERVSAIRQIWSYATGMLGISIPLTAITDSPIIPLVVAAGASLATAIVWTVGSNPREKVAPLASPTASADAERIRELEERLANLEVMNRFEATLAQKDAALLAEGSVVADPIEAPARSRLASSQRIAQ